MIAVPVIGFVIDAIHMRVSGVIARRVETSAWPLLSR